MIITINALRARVRRHGNENFRYIGRCVDGRYPDGSGYTLAIIDDCCLQETVHVDADDETVEKIVGKCER